MAITYTQELLDRATAYVGQPLTSRRYEAGLVEIGEIYAAITSEPAAKCRQCKYSDYLAVITAFIREATRFLHPETMADSNYTLAPGYENETFVHEDFGQAITAENLTDEAAKFFISKGFVHAFLKKEGAKVAKPDPEKPLTEKQQLQADFEKLFGSAPDDKITVAHLKEHIAAKEGDANYQPPTA